MRGVVGEQLQLQHISVGKDVRQVIVRELIAVTAAVIIFAVIEAGQPHALDTCVQHRPAHAVGRPDACVIVHARKDVDYDIKFAFCNATQSWPEIAIRSRHVLPQPRGALLGQSKINNLKLPQMATAADRSQDNGTTRTLAWCMGWRTLFRSPVKHKQWSNSGGA
jgi:hypothetical protein